MSQGYVMCNGLRFEVVGITLERGKVVFSATRSGPVEPGGGWCTVFGSDGIGVFQGARMEWGKVSRGWDLTLCIEQRTDAVVDR